MAISSPFTSSPTRVICNVWGKSCSVTMLVALVTVEAWNVTMSPVVKTLVVSANSSPSRLLSRRVSSIKTLVMLRGSVEAGLLPGSKISQKAKLMPGVGVLTAPVQSWLKSNVKVKDPGWQEQSEAIYRTHLGSLSEAYFQRAQQRLKGLQLWTQGRAKKTRPNGAEGTGDSEFGQ